jgi:hypothetical protein
VHLEDAAREWEVLLEEALEDSIRVRGGAPHGRTPPRGPHSSETSPPPPPRRLPPALDVSAASRRVRAGLRSVGPNWRSPPEQLRWTEWTEPIGPTKKHLVSSA